MASEEDNLPLQLLFYGSFVHDPTENELRVDMIKFSHPVNIKEIRIIPKCCKLHTSLNEPDKIGLTTPDSMKLDFSVNDANNVLLPTFISLPSLNYSVSNFVQSVSPEVQSDILLMKGLYKALTVCVYGCSKFTATGSDIQKKRPIPGLQNEDGSKDEDELSAAKKKKLLEEGEEFDGKSDFYGEELFEPFSPDHSPSMFDLFDDDLPPPPPTGKRQTNASGYEEFSDDEIAFGDDDFDQEGDAEIYSDDMDIWFASSVSFNPYQCTVGQLKHLDKISKTSHQTLISAKEDELALQLDKQSWDDMYNFHDVVLKCMERITPRILLETLEVASATLYPSLGLLERQNESEAQAVLAALVSWVGEILSGCDLVMNCPPGINVRLIKASLDLVQRVCELGDFVVNHILENNILGALVKLSLDPLMAVSLRLLAVTSIRSVIAYPGGANAFIKLSEEEEEMKSSFYRLLLNEVLSGQMPLQLHFEVVQLLKTFNVYELLLEFKESMKELVDAAQDIVNVAETAAVEVQSEDGGKEVKISEGSTNENSLLSPTDSKMGSRSKKRDEERPLLTDLLPEETVLNFVLSTDVKNFLKLCFNGIKGYISENQTLECKSSFHSVFSTKTESKSERFFHINKWLTDCCFLENICFLLSLPVLSGEIWGPLRDLLLELMTFQSGLIFLNKPEVINDIVQSLCQEAIKSDIPFSTTPPLRPSLKEEERELFTPNYLGILIVYHLQALYYLDEIKQQLPKPCVEDLDDPKCLSLLQQLYSMTLTPAGKQAVAGILSMEHNLSILLPFIEPKGNREHDLKLKKQCISNRYVLLLLIQLLQDSANSRFLLTNCKRILSVADFFKDNTSSLISSIFHWTNPLRTMVNLLDKPHQAVVPLMDIISEEIPKLSCYKSSKSIQPILTSLRVIHLLLNSPSQAVQGSSRVDTLMELMSCESMDNLTTLLQKIADILLPFLKQRQIPSVSIQNYLMSAVKVALSVLEVILSELQDCHTYKFSDTTLLHALFSVHAVFCAFPMTRVISQAADDIQDQVIGILSLFSRFKTVTSGSEGDSKSAWSSLLHILFKEHMPSCPQSCLNGLVIFCQLLPLPLPVEVPQGLLDTDAPSFELMSYRQTWQEHLKPFMNDILTFIKALMVSPCVDVAQPLRRVCIKLADLSPTVALSVCRCILELLDDLFGETVSFSEQKEKIQEKADVKKESEKKASGNMLSVLANLCVILEQPSLKIAFIELISAKRAAIEKTFPHLLPQILHLLTTSDQEDVKLCILVILQALCNFAIAFPSGRPPSRQDVANSSLPMLYLSKVINSAWSVMVDAKQPYSIVTYCQKLLLTACSYDQGIQAVYSLFPSWSPTVKPYIRRLTETFKTDTLLSKEFFDCVTDFLELLDCFLFDIEKAKERLHSVGKNNVLKDDLAKFEEKEQEHHSSSVIPLFDYEDSDNVDEEGEGFVDEMEADIGVSSSLEEIAKAQHEAEMNLEDISHIRSLSIPSLWISEVLIDQGKNTLEDLNEAVEDYCNRMKQQDLKEFKCSAQDTIANLENLTKNATDVPIKKPHLEFPERLNIHEQFEDRSVTVTTSDIIRSAPSDVGLWLTEPPSSKDAVKQETTVIDLQEMGGRFCPSLNIEEELQKQLLPSPPQSPRQKYRKGKSNLLAEKLKMRKEALLRRGPISGGGKHVFRSRKSTTSRAPSMHVDDFVKLGQQSHLPQNLPHFGLHPYVPSAFMHSQLSSRAWSLPGSQFGSRDLATLIRMPSSVLTSMRAGLR